MKLRGALLLAVAALAARGVAQPLFSDIGTMEAGLSEITGLRFTRPVPYALMGKEQLRRDLERRIHDSIKPSELRAEELTLKLLGLVPPDFDLRENTVDLLTEQAAAFYDYNKKKLFILEGSDTGAEERVALVHELAHALADQHFHLGKFIHEGQRSDDGSTARQAVMEGQASWLMAAYLARQSGVVAGVPDSVLAKMTNDIEGTAAQYPVFSKEPLYVRESLVFPYSRGMLFQDEVYRKMGRDAFSEIFLHPPESTQQILHPDRYLAGMKPVVPRLPAIPSAHEFRELAEGSLGELDFRILLSQYIGREEGEPLAAHLAGGSYQVLEHKRGKFPVLVFASTWDSGQSALTFFEKYRQVLQGKWKKLEIESDTPTRLEGRGDTGYFKVWVDGATVQHLEGWKSSVH
jgi:hypothetical protein